MSRITEKQAIDLVQKLSRTANFPQEVSGIRDMARALMDAARSDATMAGRIIEELRKSVDFCPTDAQFYRTAEGLRGDSYKPLDFVATCPRALCDGSGWLPARDHAGNDAAKRCACNPARQEATAAAPTGMRQVVDGAKRAAGDRE